MFFSTELGRLVQGPDGEEGPELNVLEKVERNMVKNLAISYPGLLPGSESSSLPGNLVTAKNYKTIGGSTPVQFSPLAGELVRRAIAEPLATGKLAI